MADRFLELYSTSDVLAARQKYYGRRYEPERGVARDELGESEAAFISTRDHFIMATVTSEGWPYVQHRGGEPGFLRVLDARTIGFADFSGNRQLISTGNLAANDRVALFLIDYPQRVRLKISGRARIVDPQDELRARLMPEVLPPKAKIERLMIIEVEGFDWNCPQHITPRYTAAEVEEAIAPLRARIAELEAALARARSEGGR